MIWSCRLLPYSRWSRYEAFLRLHGSVGFIRPRSITYSTLPQTTRLDAKLAAHTTKCIASHKGTSHKRRRTTPSPTTDTPTSQAIVNRNTKYVSKYEAAIQCAGACTAAAMTQGSTCVNSKAAYEAGRHKRTVRAQRN